MIGAQPAEKLDLNNPAFGTQVSGSFSAIDECFGFANLAPAMCTPRLFFLHTTLIDLISLVMTLIGIYFLRNKLAESENKSVSDYESDIHHSNIKSNKSMINHYLKEPHIDK